MTLPVLGVTFHYGASPAPHPGAINRGPTMNRGPTPLRKCVGERGSLPCNNSAGGRLGDQLRIESHYDREELTVFKSYIVPPA